MKKNKDKILIGSDMGNGVYPFIRRKETETGTEVSMGRAMVNNEQAPALEGTTSLATLRHIRGAEYEITSERTVSSGPAQVASDSYRRGWDGIFGKKATVGQA